METPRSVMLSPSVLVVLLLSVPGALASGMFTYRRVDPESGAVLVCERCPPGTRLRAHCSESRRTECAPCEPGLFTEFWNYLPSCLMCDACMENQRQVFPCNGSRNSVCECEPGFHWDQFFCKRHRKCEVGAGVRIAGTFLMDTVCEPCAAGEFADVTQADAECVKHSVCRRDEIRLLRGSRWHDKICSHCHQVTDSGWSAAWKSVLAALRVHYQISVDRLIHLVNQRLSQNGTKKFSRRTATDPLPSHRTMHLASHENMLARVIARSIVRARGHCNSKNWRLADERERERERE